MTKKTETQEQPINYNEFGYFPDDKVEISGAFFEGMVEFLKKVQEDNTQTVFKQLKKGDDFFGQTPQITYNAVGYTALAMLDTIFELHEQNVLAGKARTHVELEKYYENQTQPKIVVDNES